MAARARPGRSQTNGPSGREPTFALIAGGGTGGHVIPALAIGQALVERGHPAASIGFVGSRRGMESRLVPLAGFEVTLLPGRGLARRLSASNVGAVAGLLQAFVQAVILVGRRRPRVIVSVGGYASVAGALGAVVWRVPLVVAEQNAVPGLANRLAARAAKVSAVAFPGTPLPRAVVTGNPVRPEMAAIDRSPDARARARHQLGLPPERFTVVVGGGSLGARSLNQAVLGLIAAWHDRGDIAIRHIVGDRDWDEAVSHRPVTPPGGLVYQQVRFEDHMEVVYAAVDLAVHRSGSSTVCELAIAGLPSLLVPLPGAPGDHQGYNARLLEGAGAAVLIDDAVLDAGLLGRSIDGLRGDRERLRSMGEAARGLARPGAAAAVAQLAEEAARA
ncbi:MAG: UDP-N-acetylglucosamine--N-acetylmuramyl-(pentapeptide) pyrophosphoryl-undecaprenol N-acetylglucosamine transferase [Acidimicrobiales bacterium]